ncbi:hypothetical protein LEP1GSC120_0440 [Leptospira santarosai str. 200702252]|nr:hypothetical protein LEP1GSC130_2360 [Leptospira santarosai str. 200403458]EMO97479.1 hypothetical protein LEP1GSC120_0440 [Leptospira santarosai str. 200702252]
MGHSVKSDFEDRSFFQGNPCKTNYKLARLVGIYFRIFTFS